MTPRHSVLVALCLVSLAAPAAAQWADSLRGVEIPDRPAAGRVHGRDFVVETAKLENGILSLRQGADFFADLEITVFLFLDRGEGPAGKSFERAAFDTWEGPHIWKKWKPEGEDMPEQEGYTKDIVLRLELGQVDGTRLAGRIYVAIDDAEKTWVAGTFEAEVPPPPRPVESTFDAKKDSLQTLQGLARARLEADHAGETIEIVDYETSYFLPVAPRQTGVCKVEYQAGGKPGTAVFEFAKDGGQWRITGVK